jgi:hypothetical protein
LEDHLTSSSKKEDELTVKFAIVEEMLRQVRPIKGSTDEHLRDAATALLARQHEASKGRNPPELSEL